jgi:hypothetical protein
MNARKNLHKKKMIGSMIAGFTEHSRGPLTMTFLPPTSATPPQPAGS